MTQFRQQFKLRMHNNSEKKKTYELTVPSDIAILFNSETSFFIYKSGNSIIYKSGCSFEQIKKEAKKTDLEEFKTNIGGFE